MKKTLFISSMVATLLLGTATLTAKEASTATQSVSKTQKDSIQKEVKKQKDAFTQAPKEIVEGFNQTVHAIEALEHKQKDVAKKALKSATKSFEAALKADASLDIVPFEQEIAVHEFLGDSASVQKALTLAETLIVKYDTQAARVVMMPLEDEMIVTTHAIPMKLYPLATKDALKALEDGKEAEALDILHTSFNTIVSETVLIPLPLLIAEDLVIAASAIDKVKKEDALVLLSSAQDELKKAVYLGYTKKRSPAYKALEEEIEGIKKEIKGKNVVEKLYDKIKESFKSLISQSDNNTSK